MSTYSYTSVGFSVIETIEPTSDYKESTTNIYMFGSEADADSFAEEASSHLDLTALANQLNGSKKPPRSAMTRKEIQESADNASLQNFQFAKQRKTRAITTNNPIIAMQLFDVIS